MDLASFDLVTRLTYLVERRLARFADLIIANSEAGADLYRQASGGRAPVVVVPNGFDLAAFAPDAEAGIRARAELGMGRDDIVIGMVARIDPMKDHDTFLEAAALALGRRRDLRFVCVGGGPTEAMERLRAKAEHLGIVGNVSWLGESGDTSSLYNAFDIATLASKGEGFPNVIAEAMACGVPCVASDVGAAREIVDGHGLLTPPGDANALAAGWMLLLDRLGESGTQMRQAARQWIVDQYGLDALVDRSLAAFRTVVEDVG
jgi:glycosyltransferase involved in cell wall biosynthesis